jgi:NAD(P)-dependent dehydrogenase (short-subunit alcohol dehydrogenase family)
MKLDSSIAAVVTGGASGLGGATVRALAANGVTKVGIFDLPHQKEKAEALIKEIGGGVFCECDVTNEEQVDAAFAKARAANGQERILVNCAGVGGSVKTVSRDKQTGEIKEYPTARPARSRPSPPTAST